MTTPAAAVLVDMVNELLALKRQMHESGASRLTECASPADEPVYLELVLRTFAQSAHRRGMARPADEADPGDDLLEALRQNDLRIEALRGEVRARMEAARQEGENEPPSLAPD